MPSVPCLDIMPRWLNDKCFMASVTWSPRDSSFISHFPFNATSKQANKNDAKGSLYAIQSNLHHYKTDTLKIFFHCACNRTALQEPNLPTRKSIDVTMPRSQKWKKGSFWYLQLPIYTCRHQHCYHKITNHSLLLGSFHKSSEVLIQLLFITEPAFGYILAWASPPV